MERAWEDDGPAAKFMRRLVRERAVEFMRSPDYLLPLRFDYERARRDQKHFGHIWEEYGTNVYRLIAEAHGENWDAEDEEKQMYASRAAPTKKKEVAITQRAQPQNDDLVTTREAGPRERLDELQGKPEARVVVVEEDEGQGIEIGKGGGSAPAKAEAEAAPEEEGGRRREDFYRRAGGGSPS